MVFNARATWLPSPAALTAKYLPRLTVAMLLRSAVQPGPWPVLPGLTSIVYVVMAYGLCSIHRDHSSAMLLIEPVGEIGIVVVSPLSACSPFRAAVLSELLSCAGPLLR